MNQSTCVIPGKHKTIRRRACRKRQLNRLRKRQLDRLTSDANLSQPNISAEFQEFVTTAPAAPDQYTLEFGVITRPGCTFQCIRLKDETYAYGGQSIKRACTASLTLMCEGMYVWYIKTITMMRPISHSK